MQRRERSESECTACASLRICFRTAMEAHFSGEAQRATFFFLLRLYARASLLFLLLFRWPLQASLSPSTSPSTRLSPSIRLCLLTNLSPSTHLSLSTLCASIFQNRAQKLWSQIRSTLKQMETSGTELESFQALQKQERLAASYRINGLWEEVQKQKELEQTLQMRYGHFVADLERIQPLIDEYRAQAQKEEEVAVSIGLVEASADQTSVPMSEASVPKTSDDLEISVSVDPSQYETLQHQMEVDSEKEQAVVDTNVNPPNHVTSEDGMDGKLLHGHGVLERDYIKVDNLSDEVVKVENQLPIGQLTEDVVTNAEVPKEDAIVDDRQNDVECGSREASTNGEIGKDNDLTIGDAMQVPNGEDEKLNSA